MFPMTPIEFNKPSTQITPFTHRDGATFLQKLESIPRFIERELIPAIDAHVGDVDDKINSIINYIEANPAINGPIHNIIGYGADVNNSPSENAVAIQAAIDSAENTRGTVYVPPGTFYVDKALIMRSNVNLTGVGVLSVIKNISLDNGGTGIGHRLIDASNIENFTIKNITFDSREMFIFNSGMRTILAANSKNYKIDNVTFYTPGAAVASINSNNYIISNIYVEIATATGLVYHDGIVDQWGGCHDFSIQNVVIEGKNLARYAILVTGEGTDGAPAPCYNFNIVTPKIYNTDRIAIWVNGREGVNHDFTIVNPLIENVKSYFGIALSDVETWTLSSPTIKNVASNAIRVYAETSEGGSYAGKNGTIVGAQITNSNVLLLAGNEGAAIYIAAGCSGISLSGCRIKGDKHTYATVFGSNLINVNHSHGSYDVGTLGKSLNDPNSSTYTPVAVAGANTATIVATPALWQRNGDRVTVSGRVTITPTASGTNQATVATLSLPIASNLTAAANDLFGTAATQFGSMAAIFADVTNKVATIQFPAQNTSANIFYYTFTYQIK